MAIFGRRAARQRLRKATQESLAIPTFSSPPDCTPWVIGGLWPADLSPENPETASLAEVLRSDLQRIAGNANEELISIRRAPIADSARRAAESQLIAQARAMAVRRVESTLRQLRGRPHPDSHDRRPGSVTRHSPGNDLETTLVLPPVQADPPEVAHPSPAASIPADAVAPEDPHQRLRRLLSVVVRQEPRLGWAIGDTADGSTVLVTDLAHGWIPPGIVLPEIVQVVPPGQRTGRAVDLLGAATHTARYTPGDPVGGPAEFTDAESSTRPLQLPTVTDLPVKLEAATRTSDELPRMVHRLAKAAAAGTGVADEEIDLLRVHLETARYRLVAQYPEVNSTQLLNCMLLAATEGAVTDDEITANYHFAWFQKLNTLPSHQ
ncbi:DUF5631 domain-containing protein [Mycobacterium sp. 1423905.2]|uniref:DUF5631 domain-containing protein n=1 Tax=Mycobacterium sp. 1423905.2 TaxID=1856859 RepID=UPI000802482D|nr:DUF5631 domain-containing protein [Mycobacterium sp. 1423905.2]OBJ50858.1 vegetative cell wall protein precursor [Mycobacterium sp. 1423905.2]